MANPTLNLYFIVKHQLHAVIPSSHLRKTSVRPRGTAEGHTLLCIRRQAVDLAQSHPRNSGEPPHILVHFAVVDVFPVAAGIDSQ